MTDTSTDSTASADGAVDCEAVMAKLYEFLDGEIDQSRRQELEGHLHGCVSCFEAFDFEAELREMIKSKLAKDECCPDSLRQKVLDALNQVGTDGEDRV